MPFLCLPVTFGALAGMIRCGEKPLNFCVNSAVKLISQYSSLYVFRMFKSELKLVPIKSKVNIGDVSNKFKCGIS